MAEKSFWTRDEYLQYLWDKCQDAEGRLNVQDWTMAMRKWLTVCFPYGETPGEIVVGRPFYDELVDVAGRSSGEISSFGPIRFRGIPVNCAIELAPA